MKPFQTVLLIVFGLAALLAIGLFATFKGGGGPGGTGGPVAIWGTLPADSMNAFLAALGETDRRFGNVSYREVPLTSFSIELANAIAEGAGPDLLLISQEQLMAERSKLMLIPSESISEREFVDSYVPSAELFLTTGGTYGIPFVVDPLVLYYNRAILANAAFPSAPTTWEAVSALASALSIRTDAGGVLRSVIPFGEYTNVMNARAIVSLLLLQAGTPIAVETSTGYLSALAGDEYGARSASAIDFLVQFSNPSKVVYTWNRSLPSSRDMFTVGDLVFYPGFASERPFLTAANPNLDFDVAPMPQPSIAENRVSYGTTYAFAVPRASLNAAGALTIAFALSAEGARAAPFLSVVPAIRGAAIPVDDRFASVFYPEAYVMRGWISPAPSVTDGIFAGMLGNITSGRRETEEALRSAGESLEATGYRAP